MLRRLRDSPKPRALFVSHGFGGGVRRHIEELARAIDSGADVVLLTPRAADRLELRRLDAAEPFALWPAKADWEAVVGLLRAIGFDHVHFHHVHGLPPEVLDLPQRLGCSHDFTLHDHFPICAQYHLLGGDGRFCGAERDCTRCHELQPPQWPVTVDEWRRRFGEALAGARRVIAPSRDTADRIRDHFPRSDPVVWPHPGADRAPPVRATRVGVPGAISPAKGLSLLVECARDARARGLPLHFHVVGYVAYPIPAWPEVPLTIGGEYREGELPDLLAACGADVLFFPAQVPETYSFTLADAMDTGLPIVATDLGALPGRLEGYGRGRVLPWHASAGEFNDALLASRGPVMPARPIPRETFAGYAKRYLEGLARGRHEAKAAVRIDPAWLDEPVETDPPTTTLEWLFNDAFLCGRALSRYKLKARLRGR